MSSALVMIDTSAAMNFQSQATKSGRDVHKRRRSLESEESTAGRWLGDGVHR